MDLGEALWEPSALGYTKSDGLLVLANGEIIEDPAKASQVRDSDVFSVRRVQLIFVCLAVGRSLPLCSYTCIFACKACNSYKVAYTYPS